MEIFVKLFLILIYFTSSRRLLVHTEKTYWWRAALDPRYPIKRVGFFSRYMQEHPSQKDCIRDGAIFAVKECRRLFKYNRWNCQSAIYTKPFGRIMEIGCSETAFIYAITSAGLVFNMIRACSQGKLFGCNNRCIEPDKFNLKSTRLLNKTHSKDNACDDNFEFGIKVWYNFLFKSETSSDIRARFNIRNSQVGLQEVLNSVNLICRCHGVSGSCVLNICSQKVASHFEIIGQKIYERYKRAQFQIPHQKEIETHAKNVIKEHTKYSSQDALQKYPPIPLKRRRKHAMKSSAMTFGIVPNLEYYQESPDFCPKSPYGVGTINRACKPYVSAEQYDSGERSCDDICCYGRGIKTVKVVELSNCKFVYCCDVLCDENTKLIDVFYCH